MPQFSSLAFAMTAAAEQKDLPPPLLQLDCLTAVPLLEAKVEDAPQTYHLVSGELWEDSQVRLTNLSIPLLF